MRSIRTTLALVALAAAGFAQAQEATPLPMQPSMSTLDRAAVLAETRDALWANRIVWGNEGPEAFGRSMSQRTRAAVLAEAAAANRLSSADLLQSRLVNGM
jgi:hypothetical protein